MEEGVFIRVEGMSSLSQMDPESSWSHCHGLWSRSSKDILEASQGWRPNEGSDGKIRGAIIWVGSKKGKSSTFRRPIQHLYPLEAHCINKTETSNCSVNQLPDTITECPKYPSPVAACAAWERMKTWCTKLDL